MSAEFCHSGLYVLTKIKQVVSKLSGAFRDYGQQSSNWSLAVPAAYFIDMKIVLNLMKP